MSFVHFLPQFANKCFEEYFGQGSMYLIKYIERCATKDATINGSGQPFPISREIK